MLSTLLLLTTTAFAAPCAPSMEAGALSEHMDAALDDLSAMPEGELSRDDIEQALDQFDTDGMDLITGFADLLSDGLPRSIDGAVVADLLEQYAPELAAVLPLDALSSIESDGSEVTLNFDGDVSDINVPANGDRGEMAVRITRPAVSLQITPDGFRSRQLGALRIASAAGGLPSALLSLRPDAGAVLRFSGGESESFPLPSS